MKRQEIQRRPMPDAVIASLEPEAQMYRELHADDVYLRVKPNGMKDWQLRYLQEDGSSVWLDLGGFGKAAHQLTGQFARQQAIELLEDAKRRGVSLLAAMTPSEAPCVPQLANPVPDPCPEQGDGDAPVAVSLTQAARMSHISLSELPHLIRAMRGYPTRPIAIGLQLLLLLGVRPTELREAQWSEFDLDAGVWNVASGRQPERRDGRLALPHQALALLHELHAHRAGGAWLFPGRSKSMDKPIGNMAFNHALDRLGYKGRQTPNGMRDLFTAAAHAAGQEARVVASAPAQQRKQAGRSGRGAEGLNQRPELLQWWADQLDAMAAS